ncbi:hypothetical protein RDABS01_019564 [Bienertia sinuspersici]
MATEEIETEMQMMTINSYWRKPIEGRLPPDSLIQIWARLPIKSLYKFRSVCKLWNFLISSDPLLPDLRHHLSHSISFQQPPNLLILLRHLNNEPVKVPDRPIRLSTRPFEEIIRVDRDPNTHPVRNGFTPYVDFCVDFVPSNGPIVCFAADQYFYLCNPSTQEFLRLSPGQNGNSRTSNGAFGYLGDLNRYVLVALTGEKCELLKFGPGQAGSGSWREVKQKCPARVTGFGLMVNQDFYWKLSSDESGFVLCLDVKKEEFRPPRMGIWVLNQIEGEEGGDMMLCNDTRSRLYCYNLKNRSIKQVFRPKHRTNDRLAFGQPHFEPSSHDTGILCCFAANVLCFER